MRTSHIANKESEFTPSENERGADRAERVFLPQALLDSIASK
jgi:hypothetical protein